MKIKDRLIDLAESILDLKVQRIDSFQNIADFFLVLVFPLVQNFGELFDVSHFR